MRPMKYSMMNSNVSSSNSNRPMDNMQNPKPMSNNFLNQKSIFRIYLYYCINSLRTTI